MDQAVQPKRQAPPALISKEKQPFSFTYDGKPSDQLLGQWSFEHSPGREKSTWSWTDPHSKLRVTCESRAFDDFPALEWVVWFENTGSADTPILHDVQALDFHIPGEQSVWRLHRSNGSPCNASDFEPNEIALTGQGHVWMGGGRGRSSNKDLPFFKFESGDHSLIIAVGWSGQWLAKIQSFRDKHVWVRAGMEWTNFRLRPGEKVRSPRMLILDWRGDTLESNNAFRQLIYRHYAAKRVDADGIAHPPLPLPFCNTCFSACGGGWLNECNEQNQISLIDAYAPLHLEALITDAGWFEGGWPAGAGNWTPRKDAYPRGMAPVAEAAREKRMIYGLWFEPERVVKGTQFHRQHPDWCLSDGWDPNPLLADFGRAEVREYFFQIVKGFMNLPGFRFYRQDFNMDPLECWRHGETADRQGITEMHYIEGLYEFWDRIAAEWPDSIREECASGGRRIDLETVMRLHVHQCSDHWFDNEADQGRIWSLSQYLPNCIIDLPVCRLDDYTFHSVMASSLVLGWIADAPDFDTPRAQRLMETYVAHRELLVGSFYPLLAYSRLLSVWNAYQFHRADLGRGMVLAFRHGESNAESCTLALRGLLPEASYQVDYHGAGKSERVSGANLLRGISIAIPAKPGSELITYRVV